uniref:DUF1989 domain-containing protein n=1 Tax=Panagrellus redivivus TaxID=6233 RepID=A0A7E4ZPV7_PANRE
MVIAVSRGCGATVVIKRKTRNNDDTLRLLLSSRASTPETYSFATLAHADGFRLQRKRQYHFVGDKNGSFLKLADQRLWYPGAEVCVRGGWRQEDTVYFHTGSRQASKDDRVYGARRPSIEMSEEGSAPVAAAMAMRPMSGLFTAASIFFTLRRHAINGETPAQSTFAFRKGAQGREPLSSRRMMALKLLQLGMVAPTDQLFCGAARPRRLPSAG